MQARWFVRFCFSICCLAAAASLLHAQNRGPGGPPGGGSPPGAPGAPAGPGGPGNHNAPPPPAQGSKGQNNSAGTGGNVQFGPVGRWWDDKSVVKSIGLTSDQKKKMDAIFDANKPAILAAYRDFLKQQSALDAISKDPKADKSQTFAAIDAVNRARADLQKTVAQTYLEIRQTMSPEQVEQLEKLQ
jgi:Spy/CpxP family protein refolding chaperone